MTIQPKYINGLTQIDQFMKFMKIIYYNWHKLTLFRPGCYKLTVSLQKKKTAADTGVKKIEWSTLQVYTTTYEHANECFLICMLTHKDVHIDARKWKILK